MTTGESSTGYHLFPFGPQVRKEIAVPLVTESLQKYEGCYIEYPPESIVLPPQLQLPDSSLAETDNIRTCLGIIASYLNSPVVLDRFNQDEAGRASWKQHMQKQYGKFFPDIYDAGKLRRIRMSTAITAMLELVEPPEKDGFGLGQYLGIQESDFTAVRQKLKAHPATETSPGYEPYAHVPVNQKLEVTKEVNQLARRILQKFMPLSEQQGAISQRMEQVAEISSYLQEITPYEVAQALGVRDKLNQLGLLIGPDCMDGWKWFPNTWPSKDPEGKGRDILRMILDASYKFLPKELQDWFHVNWCFNPVHLDGAAEVGPPSKEALIANSDKQIILGLIASNAFDFHVELASYTLGPKEKEEFIQYWLKLKELVTHIGIKPDHITDHLGFLDSKNLKEALEQQHPYNFEQILLSSPHEKAQLALGQAKEQVERLAARGSKYLTIHGTPLLTPLNPEGFINLKNNLGTLVEEAEKLGVHICLETQGETKEQLAELLKAIPQLKITWDIAHVYLNDQKFNHHERPIQVTHLTNEDFFNYLAQDRVAMLHLGQPTLDEARGVPQDSHYPLFYAKGLISQDFLKRMFKEVQKYNHEATHADKVHLTFESPLKFEDYDKILQAVESP
jgi:hypothetical protein